MKRILVFAAVLAALAGGAWLRLAGPLRPATPTVLAKPEPPARVVAAPGLVEAATEERAVHAEIAGLLTSVPVEEGQAVKRGQILATLDDAAYRARVEAAQADRKQREAELQRALNGATELERRAAWVAMKEAEAVVDQARAELVRRRKLFELGVFAWEQVERADHALKVAQERAQAAWVQRAIVAQRVRDEDKQRSEAALEAAKARLQEARVMLSKTIIRAPLAGVVVRKYLRAGELASEASKPIITIADLSRLRVRAEVDEADIMHVWTGQPAFVTAPGYGDRKFAGQVIRIGQALGRKNVRTDEPAERVDTKVLETLIELEPGTTLPLGLRVTAFLRADR